MSGITSDLNDLVGASFTTGNEGIVVVANLEGIPGGATLDVAAYTPDVIPEGHPVIEETSTGYLKPMPVTGTPAVFAAIPAGHTYRGHVVSNTLKAKPFVGVTIRGTINFEAASYGMGTIVAALRTANPLITYMKD